MKRLTDLTIERLSVPEKERVIFDSGAVGLMLKLTPKGRRIWAAWLRFPGCKAQSGRTIGTHPVMKVEEAREKARLWHGLVAQGIDPSAVERAEKQQAEDARAAAALKAQNTFGAYAEAYIKGRKTRRAKQEAWAIRAYLLPHFEKKPLHEMTPRDVRQAMTALRAKSDHSANCAWGHLSLILRRAVHEEVIPSSPMASLSKKLVFEGARIGPRTRVLNDEEIAAYWRAAGRLGYPDGPYFRLLLLTGLRLNELAKARWSELHPELRRLIRGATKSKQEIDWATVPAETKTLTIPPERFKSDAEHVVELSDDSCAIIASLPWIPSCDFLFTAKGKTPIWVNSKNKRRLDARMLLTLKALARKRGDDPRRVKLPPFVNHDLRRVLRSNLAALCVADHIGELALGHSKKGLQRIYDMHKYERQIRAAMEQWAARLREIVGPSTGPEIDNVTRLRKVG